MDGAKAINIEDIYPLFCSFYLTDDVYTFSLHFPSFLAFSNPYSFIFTCV